MGPELPDRFAWLRRTSAGSGRINASSWSSRNRCPGPRHPDPIPNASELFYDSAVPGRWAGHSLRARIRFAFPAFFKLSFRGSFASDSPDRFNSVLQLCRSILSSKSASTEWLQFCAVKGAYAGRTRFKLLISVFSYHDHFQH